MSLRISKEEAPTVLVSLTIKTPLGRTIPVNKDIYRSPLLDYDYREGSISFLIDSVNSLLLLNMAIFNNSSFNGPQSSAD